MPRPKSGWMLALFLLGALGCSKKVPECNALIEQINGSATAMEAATREFSTSKQTKDASDKFARKNQDELAKLDRVALTLPELQGFSKSYRGLLGSVATAAIAIGRSHGELDELRQTVAKSQGDWAVAYAKLTTACAKAQKECKALGERLPGPPSLVGKPEDDAKTLEAYAKGLASSGVKNPELAAATRDLEKAALEFVARLKKSASAQIDYEQALKALSDINAKEPALIQSINDFCQSK